MKTAPLAFAFLMFMHPMILCADDSRPVAAALTAADDERVVAFTTADKALLDKVLSGDLHYAHSNGVVDDKSSMIATLLSGKTKYLRCDYLQREFSFPSADLALMTGRVRIQADTATGLVDNTLSYLAVWKHEPDGWRFLAWQSCRLPVTDAP